MALKQYIQNAKDIAGTFEIFNKKLNMTGFSGANPYLEENILQNIKYVKDAQKISKYINSVERILSRSDTHKSTVVEDVFKVYSELLIIRNKLQQCLDIFIEHQVNPIQKGSQTSTGSTITEDLIYDLQNNLSDLVETMDSYLTQSEISKLTNDFSDAIIYYLAEDYVSDEHVKQLTDTYSSYVSKGFGMFVINLFESVMQNSMDVNTGHPKGSKVIRNIIIILESLKTTILHSPRLELVEDFNKKNNTVQRLIQWNNLVPNEELLPFSLLIHKLIGIKCEENELHNACKVVSTSTEKIGFIVIYKVTNKPIEHRVIPLIDKQYAISHGMLQSGNVGINKKLYERTQTIVTLERSNSKQIKDRIDVYDREHVISSTHRKPIGKGGGEKVVRKAERKTERKVAEAAETAESVEAVEAVDGNPVKEDGLAEPTEIASSINYFYIVETIDGITFRVMHPWNIDTHDFKIPASWVQNIPHIKKTPSQRLAGYSEIINDAILMHLQKPLLEIDFMSRKEKIKADIKWKNIKDNITRKLQEAYDINKHNISGLLASDKFQNSVIQQIIVQLEKELGGEVRESEFEDGGITKKKNFVYFEEMSLSYIKDLDAIQNQIGRELVNIYQREYKDSNKSINIIFADLMDRVLSKIMNNKSNIFNTIRYKSELMRKTLLS